MAVDLLARLRVATLQMLLLAIDTELRVVGRRHGTIRLLPPVMNGIMTDEDLNFIGPIAPVKLFSGREGRCSAKLLFGNFKFIGTMFRIVF
jgi:hypothetical protein